MTLSISSRIEDNDTDLLTPKVPRGRPSDLTEQDLETFSHSFSKAIMLMSGHLE